ncbi:MAG: hypothetical protein RSB82_02115 [Victivallaceae bacterium]
MNIFASHISKRPDIGYGEYNIEPVDAVVKNSPSWQKAVLIVSLALVITGVVCLILAATIMAPPVAIKALFIIGSQCLETGLGALLIFGIVKLVSGIQRRKQNDRENMRPSQEHRIETSEELMNESWRRSVMAEVSSENEFPED